MSQKPHPCVAAIAYIRPEENLVREAVWIEELILLASKYDVPWFKEEGLFLYELCELREMLCTLRNIDESA